MCQLRKVPMASVQNNRTHQSKVFYNYRRKIQLSAKVFVKWMARVTFERFIDKFQQLCTSGSFFTLWMKTFIFTVVSFLWVSKLLNKLMIQNDTINHRGWGGKTHKRWNMSTRPDKRNLFPKFGTSSCIIAPWYFVCRCFDVRNGNASTRWSDSLERRSRPNNDSLR